MKIFLRISLGVLAFIFLSIVGLYFYVTNENVQKAYVEKLLKDSFELPSSIGSIKADLSGLRATKLKINDKDYSFHAEEITLSYSNILFSLFFDEINIDDAKIKNATLDFAELISDKGEDEEDEKTFGKLNLFVANLESDICIKHKGEIISYLDIKAQKLQLDKTRDLRSLILEAKIHDGVVKNPLLLNIQAEELGDKRNLQALLKCEGEQELKILAEYSPFFKEFNLKLEGNITENTLPIKGIKNSGVNIKLYSEIKFEKYFKKFRGVLSIDGETQNLNFENEELKLLSNSSFKIKSDFSKEKRVLSIESLDGEILQDDDILAQLKLDKCLKIKGNELIEGQDLSDLASLYIDHIPYQLLRSYLPDYDIANNDIKAHLSLSIDTEAQALLIASKKEIYFETFEVLKNEAILLSDIFLSTNFSLKIDREKNLSADINLKLLEKNKKELNAQIKLSKNAESIEADISAFGDAIVFLKHAQAHVDRVENIRNAKLDLNTHLAYTSNTLEIDGLKLKLFDGKFELFEALLGEKLVFENFELQNDTLKAKILAKSLPFSPFKAFVKDIDATSLSCDIDIEKKEENIAAKGYLSLENLSYSKVKLGGIDPKITFSLNAKDSLINAEIEGVEILHKGNQIARAKARIEADLNAENYIQKASGELALYIDSIMQLPELSDYNNIRSGYAEAQIDFDGKNIDAKAKLSNLRLRGENSYISSLNIDAKADILAPEKNLKLSLMLASPNGQSSLSADASLKDTNIIAKLSSDKLIIDDLIFLSQITKKAKETSHYSKSKETLSLEERKARAMQSAQAQKPLNAKKVTKIQPSELDTKALWDMGYTLDLDAKLNSIERDGSEVASGINTKIVLDASSIKLNAMDFNLANSKNSSVNFLLEYKANSEDRYHLNELNIKIKDIDMTKLTMDRMAGVSTMEGLLSFDIELHSKSPSLESIADNIQGKAKLSSNGNGIIRFIKTNSTVGAVSDLASSAMSIAGNFLSTKVKEIEAAEMLLNSFKEYNYSKISADIKRGDSLDIIMENLAIEGREFLIRGRGTIVYDENLEIKDQKLLVELNSYVEDPKIADLFNKLHLIEPESDRANLFQGPKFYIYGSWDNMENNVLDIISGAASHTAPSLLNNFLK